MIEAISDEKDRCSGERRIPGRTEAEGRSSSLGVVLPVQFQPSGDLAGTVRAGSCDVSVGVSISPSFFFRITMISRRIQLGVSLTTARMLSATYSHIRPRLGLC